MSEDTTNLGQVIRIDDERVGDYLRNVVRGNVEETLNAMLEAEAGTGRSRASTLTSIWTASS